MDQNQEGPLEERYEEKVVLPIRQTSAHIALVLSLFTLLGVLGLGYYLYRMQQQWSQFSTHSQQYTQDLQNVLSQAKAEADKINTLVQQNTGNQKDVEAITQDLNTVKNKLSSLAQNTNFELIALNAEFQSINEKLRINHDVPTAVLLLKAMNEKLSSIDDPNFKLLKEALANDIATLQSLPLSAPEEVWEKLSHLPEKFLQLHFKQPDFSTEKPTDADSSYEKAWQKALWRTWLELKGLIKVSREDTGNIPLILSLQEKSQVLRTMQLMTEQSQWAAINGKLIIYQKSLEELQQIIHDYFSADLYQTTLLEEIKKLQANNIAPDNVNISRTQEALSQVTKKLNIEKTHNLPFRENP